MVQHFDGREHALVRLEDIDMLTHDGIYLSILIIKARIFATGDRTIQEVKRLSTRLRIIWVVDNIHQRLNDADMLLLVEVCFLRFLRVTLKTLMENRSIRSLAQNYHQIVLHFIAE